LFIPVQCAQLKCNGIYDKDLHEEHVLFDSIFSSERLLFAADTALRNADLLHDTPVNIQIIAFLLTCVIYAHGTHKFDLYISFWEQASLNAQSWDNL
jgi:hypothetical protein